MSNPVYTIPLLPLRDVVIFPHMVAPLFVGREKSIRALEEAMKNDKKILLSAQKDAKLMILDPRIFTRLVPSAPLFKCSDFLTEQLKF
ncbi:hypothetical protein CM15mP43_11760 [bacterium]|nr:MAG: hypothetical protein CM15mP43_11760 [bacterium]